MKFRTCVCLLVLFAVPAIVWGRDSRLSRIVGKVSAGNRGLAQARVQLYEAEVSQANLIASGEADRRGRFQIKFRPSGKSLLYLLATTRDESELVLVSALGRVKSSRYAVINELTTVASVFALSQFIDGTEIFGPSPGIDNAMDVTRNLVSSRTGRAGSVVSNFQNGVVWNPRGTRARQTQNSLANMIAACAANPAHCATLFALANVDGPPPTNTLEAIHNIARTPKVQQDPERNEQLFELANKAKIYQPGLRSTPDAWILALHFVRHGFNAPGRIAFDSRGNMWSNNNFMPPPRNPFTGVNTNPGKQVVVLSPRGKPILGSPIFSRFVNGSAYGVAVSADDVAWIGNFVDSGITQFSPQGKVVAALAASATGLNVPMGLAFDQAGNAWIPNMGQSPDPNDLGSVTVFLGGDPNQRITFTPDDGDVHKPFSLAIDEQGRAWVANSSLAPAGSVTVLRLTVNDEIEQVANITSAEISAPANPDVVLRKHGSFLSPKTIATDSAGNGWVSSLESHHVTVIDGDTFIAVDIPADPRSQCWGLAVDGNDLVWVGSFSNPPRPDPRAIFLPPVISVLRRTVEPDDALQYSFSNPALQHLTALQLDSSGNVWVANNWALSTTVDQIVGGDGVVQFIGLASPVLTPLIGPPVNPAALLGP